VEGGRSGAPWECGIKVRGNGTSVPNRQVCRAPIHCGTIVTVPGRSEAATMGQDWQAVHTLQGRGCACETWSPEVPEAQCSDGSSRTPGMGHIGPGCWAATASDDALDACLAQIRHLCMLPVSRRHPPSLSQGALLLIRGLPQRPNIYTAYQAPIRARPSRVQCFEPEIS
jgi:hypothetical protein